MYIIQLASMMILQITLTSDMYNLVTYFDLQCYSIGASSIIRLNFGFIHLPWCSFKFFPLSLSNLQVYTISDYGTPYEST